MVGGKGNSREDAISYGQRWNVQHVTRVRSYYQTKSVPEVQCVFRRQFSVSRHGRAPSRNTILAWVKKLVVCSL